jgi:epoxyqueuosine reductase
MSEETPIIPIKPVAVEAAQTVAGKAAQIVADKAAQIVADKAAQIIADKAAQIIADTAAQIIALGREYGFADVGIADTDLSSEAQGFNAWIESGQHGDMEYMARHGKKRWQPDELQAGTQSVICVLLDYWPIDTADAEATLADANKGYVSRYAVGRDYHKVIRNRLQSFAEAINDKIATHSFRVFTDSAPVLEIPLAVKAGLGWRGKHTLLLNRERGSLFFLGEIYTSLNLRANGEKQTDHCGTCSACIDICPTQAITAPHRLDARRCISYLTIELKTAIPIEFRKAIGNRIYGCDDCQIVCPWNKFAKRTTTLDFEARHSLDDSTLVEFFAWSEEEFLKKTVGSAIRRIGHERWLRNVAVALGNAPASPEVVAALRARTSDASPLIREHVAWALSQQTEPEEEIGRVVQ